MRGRVMRKVHAAQQPVEMRVHLLRVGGGGGQGEAGRRRQVKRRQSRHGQTARVQG